MRKQQGIALLSVVLITAIMTLALTLFGEQLQRDARRQQNLKLYSQAWWYADSAEQVVAYSLKQLDKEKTTHLGQPWANQEQIYPLEGGSVGGTLEDLRGCFNVNGLLSSAKPGEVDPQSVKQFRYLLENLVLNELNIDALIDRTSDWLDDDFEESDFSGAEDRDYLTEEPAFYSANGPMVSLDELLLTGSISPRDLAILSEQACVAPDNSSKININTLSENQAPLLAAVLFNQINTATAKDIIRQRPGQGFRSTAELFQLPQLQGLTLSSGEKNHLNRQLVLKSDAFQASIRVQFHELDMQLSSQYLIRKKQVYRVRRILGET